MLSQIERISEFLEILENEVMTEDQYDFLSVGGSGATTNNCNCPPGSTGAVNNCNCT
jgi:hypothetical protein